MPMPPNLSEAAIRRAAATVRAVASGHHGAMAEPPPGTNRSLYTDLNPLRRSSISAAKTQASRRDRRLCPQPRPARAPGHGVAQRRVAGGADHPRRRPPRRRHPPAGAAQRLDRRRRGRPHGNRLLRRRRPRRLRALSRSGALAARRSTRRLRQALVNLGSVPAPAGEMTVVLGPGWPGVMLHEAVGHGLEGDFNRKKTSAFSGLIGPAGRARRASPSSMTGPCPTAAAR